MDQRVYGMNAPTLHHYSHNLTGSYGLGQSFHRQAPFSSMYGSGNFPSASFAYPGQSSEWSFAASHSSNIGMNNSLGSTSSNILSRDNGEYFYQGGVQVPGGLGAMNNSRGLMAATGSPYCDVTCSNSYSPPFSSSPCQSASSSPGSADSLDRTRLGGRIYSLLILELFYNIVALFIILIH
ncbi:hypothetical protein SNE40_008667 [Patella caerulea]|uniref:Uncharacterized protein n=1 Tax=Patella caerulea TaxID=87958 RepID=A0AAN8PR06_PATCE